MAYLVVAQIVVTFALLIAVHLRMNGDCIRNQMKTVALFISVACYHYVLKYVLRET